MFFYVNCDSAKYTKERKFTDFSQKNTLGSDFDIDNLKKIEYNKVEYEIWRFPMKKLLALFLAALLLFCMVACKKNEETAEDSDENKLTSEEMIKDYFVYEVAEDGNYKIVDFTYIGKDQIEVTIPAQLGEGVNQRPVTEIAENAFKAKHNISTVKIPESVVVIGAHAFYDCDYMTSIVIPASVKKIGTGAFESCSALVTVTLNAGLLEIEDAAFMSCGKLGAVTLPNTLLSIGAGAFKECDALTAVTIPASVFSIGDAAFFGCDALASLKVEDRVATGNDTLLAAMREAVLKYVAENENVDAPETFAELKNVLESLGYYLGEAKDDGCKYIWDKNTNQIYGSINAADAELVAKANAIIAEALTDEASAYNHASSLNALDLFLRTKEIELSKLNVSVAANRYSWSNVIGFLYDQELGEAIFANCPALTDITVSANSYAAFYLNDCGFELPAPVVPETTPEA